MGIKIDDVVFEKGSVLVTNCELDSEYPDWNVPEASKTTGVYQRWHLSPHENIEDLAFKTFKKFFDETRESLDDIEVLIVVTQSFHKRSPGLSSEIHKKYSLHRKILTIDLNEACGGFVKALILANSLISTNSFQSAHILCVDAYSKFTNEGDRSVRLLFSDAASMTRVSASKENNIGMLSFSSGIDSESVDYLNIHPSDHDLGKDIFFMNGAKTLIQVLNIIPKSVSNVTLNYNLDDVKFFMFHQASRVVLDGLKRELGIMDERILSNLHDMGNLGSSSIPALIASSIRQNQLEKGDLIVLSSFGIGFTWSTCLMRW